MESKELNFLVSQGESYNLEFKENFSEVEKVGSGIARMRKAMQEYGIKGPNFDISGNWFTIIFKRAVKTTQKPAQKTTQKILGLIKNNPYITRKDLAKSIGNITEDGIKYHLSVLIKKGMLKKLLEKVLSKTKKESRSR